MPTASLIQPRVLSWVLPFGPLLDARMVAGIRRRAVPVGRGVSYAVSSVALAAFLWLVLAGPGFMADGAGTGTARGGGRMMVRT